MVQPLDNRGNSTLFFAYHLVCVVALLRICTFSQHYRDGIYRAGAPCPSVSLRLLERLDTQFTSEPVYTKQAGLFGNRSRNGLES